MKKQENLQPIKKLVLHFNIQNVLTLNNNIDNLSTEQRFNLLVCQHSWGKVEAKDEKSNVETWRLLHNHISVKPQDQDLTSYYQYVDQQLPLKTESDVSDPVQRNSQNNDLKQKRQELFDNFIKAGSPGVKLKPEYERLLKVITIPKLVGEEQRRWLEKQESEKSAEQKGVWDLLQGAKYNILPQFFKLMLTLKKLKKEFAVVFRSFGSDHEPIIREFNYFCQGEHPCFNGRNNTPVAKFDGSKGTKNFIINRDHQSLLYRYADLSKTALVQGTFKRANPDRNLEDEYEKEIEDESVSIIRGHQQIFININQQLQEQCAYAIQDDYVYWRENQSKKSASQLLLIDPNDYLTQHIFFHDQVDEISDVSTQVDARDILKGESLQLKKILNMYVVKVNTIELLKDSDYFIKQIDLCEKLRTEEIDRIERGILKQEEDAQLDQQKISDYQKLAEMDDKNYLKNTILPLLHPALKLVDILRPSDPISFIALYCLKNQSKVYIPQPPEGYFDKKDQPEIQEN